MFRCAILDDYQSVALAAAPWRNIAERVEVTAFRDHLRDPVALAERLSPFDIIVAMRERTPFPRDLLEKLRNLKLLVTTGPRNAAIDVAAAGDLGVTVCGTDSTASPTAELTFALILALARHLPAESASLRSGGWQTTLGVDLAGARLGILGLGRLGARVAAIGIAFGMEVSAWSQNLTEARCREAGVALSENLDALLAAADFVSIHLVLSARTRGLIGARELSLMKPTARLINTSRGPIVDEAALIRLLAERRIAGAALDVFDEEPLPPEHPFRTLDNVLATPHLGYVTARNYANFYGGALEDIEAWLAGAPIRLVTA
jgi:phosphoglycerate dehydrogenase-like enzyme